MSDDLPQMAGHVVGDKQRRQRFIARSLYWTVPATLLVVGGLSVLLPAPAGLDTSADRLGFALRWLFVAMLPYAAVCLTILNNRLFEGSHDPLAGAESERLLIHCRVMQNTLEQLFWLAICVLALATLLPPERVQLIAIACAFFAFARFLYWWGYLRAGTLARGPGVQLTFTLNVSLLILTGVLFGRTLLSP
jgi:hypothetical protein